MSKYDYTSRWNMLKLAMTVGLRRAEQLKLGKDNNNWSPLLVYVYIVGATVGMIGGILWSVIIFILSKLLMK
jgi:hypothetical protein